MKYQLFAPTEQLANAEVAVKIIDPQAEIVSEQPDFILTVTITETWLVQVRLVTKAMDLCEEYQHEAGTYYQKLEQRLKELVRLGIITLLGQHLQRQPSWGILSAVRPTKIFHALHAQGLNFAEIAKLLKTDYALSQGKINLLLAVCEAQQNFLYHAQRKVSIYAGVPFCPTRCHYCSFPAVSLETHAHLVHDYLKGFVQETEAIGTLCREQKLEIETIYVGGGTPTSLPDAVFATFLQHLTRNFSCDKSLEFTVEAGRPETVTKEKLKMMQNAGVTRISVNPQTMQPQTLIRIGRAHTITQIEQAVALVRSETNFDLNMDLILGLPGEGMKEFEHSLKTVLQFKPENITIHTLAPKRAAAWKDNFATLELALPAELMLTAEKAYQLLKTENYFPYYIYRQRGILADLENLGFTRANHENIYNIQMMEEQQTVLGLGAGAMTKWITRPNYSVVRQQNPGCPATYQHRILETINQKVQQTRLFLG